jgi:hypothetical protein
MTGRLFVPAQDTSVNSPSYGPATVAGLMLIVNQLGTAPAQDPTVNAVYQQLNQKGAQPFVPNLQSSSQRQVHETSSPATVFTFPQNGRLWSAQLTYAIATNNSYTGATNLLYARLFLQSGVDLSLVECAVGGATAGGTPSSDSNGDRGAWNGLPVHSGDKVVLDVNNAVSITNLAQRASAVINYSIP